MIKPNRAYSVKEATKKLELYCAYQERCHKEVLAKLTELRMVPQAADHIVAHLIQENFLNEERFARSFARGKFTQKKWGKDRIVKELEQRHIATFNINAALSEIPQDAYLETLHLLAHKKWESLRGYDMLRQKRKLIAFLRYRGWESHLVYEKVRELVD